MCVLIRTCVRACVCVDGYVPVCVCVCVCVCLWIDTYLRVCVSVY